MTDIPPRRIVQLDESVINRIAAGEIIIHPANALKELLENAIDAKSTMIDVLVKDGGLKLLQITDNGSGIDKEDLGLLCERFATSKLSTFEDLSSIATYGFRGEALASISHIARLSVVTKTKSSNVAYKAYYSNGKLADSNFKNGAEVAPKPIAGKTGTTITVEDLFYNAPARLRATKSKNDEFIKILDVIGRYAVHSKVGISCKKFGDSHQALITRPNLSLKERIRTVFGSSVANEIIEFSLEMSEEASNLGLYECFGAISTSNYVNKKKIQPVLFINGRLVQCDPLKRSIMSIYGYFLPKGNQPFVYLSLQINPQNVDVNVHPTKKEVRFLNEDEIVDIVGAKVHSLLSKIDTSRTFKTQSVLTRERKSASGVSLGADTQAAEDIEKGPPVKKYRQENKLVRTDAKQLKLQSFISERNSSNDVIHSKERVDVQLSSIVELRKELVDSTHKGLTEIFNGSTYVGIIDEKRRLCSFQFGVKLFICDYAATLNEFYYQVALSEFSNYGDFTIAEPISIREILDPLYASTAPSVGIDEVMSQIFSMKDMYEEYFGIKFDEDEKLVSIPMILKNIKPVISKLPYFIYRLGAKVNYSDEKECLQGIMKEIALLYVPEPITHDKGSSDEDKVLNEIRRDELDLELENQVFPRLQQQFVATSELLDNVMEIADLPGLYRVFERC